VIAGFNTDIECAGTVYHVQTEDKGAPHRVIMSLVYNKGTILASKRESYADMAARDFNEKELKARVDRQHKLICAAVKAGRIDELKQMTAKKAAAGARAKAETVAVAEPAVAAPVAIPLSPIPSARTETPQSFKIPAASAPVKPQAAPFAHEPVIEAVEIIEDYPEIMAPEAVEVVSELSGKSRTTHNKLGIELLGESKFKSGDRRTVNIMICRGTDRKVIPGAEIMIKILGSTFRPVIFHARSDQNGLAKIHLQVPQFAAGRAALLVRAIADGEEVELRRVVTPTD
jgi:hypothetical protein